MAEATDYRRAPRRRGEVLERAIFEATLAEVSEAGYLNLSMERVAQRARTGNASLYRRWPTRAELVIDAIRHAAPDRMQTPDTGSVRSDMLALLRGLCARQAGPAGEVMRGVIAESLNNERIMSARARLAETRAEQFLEVLRSGVARGEIRQEAVTPLLAGLAPALVMHHFLLYGTPPPDRLLTEIVDEVVMPLAAPAPSPLEPREQRTVGGRDSGLLASQGARVRARGLRLARDAPAVTCLRRKSPSPPALLADGLQITACARNGPSALIS